MSRSLWMVIADGRKNGALELFRGMIKVPTLRKLPKAVRIHKWLTVFAFSSENWTRPEHEVAGLMQLIAKFIDTQAKELLDANVRLRVIGRRDRFNDDLCAAIQVWNNAHQKIPD